MIVGFPGTGKSHLLDNIFEKARSQYHSTDSMIVVGVGQDLKKRNNCGCL